MPTSMLPSFNAMKSKQPADAFQLSNPEHVLQSGPGSNGTSNYFAYAGRVREFIVNLN